jgi:recombination protein RecR
MKYPKDLDNLITLLAKYPTVGKKSAERLALHTIFKMNQEDVTALASTLMDAKNNVKICTECGMITDDVSCDICLDTREKKLMIVENVKDVIAFEKTGIYNGYYHVIFSLISPMDGVGPNDINVATIKERIKQRDIQEVIIALPSSLKGDLTLLYLKSLLNDVSVLKYSIGYGLPAGGNIEYADEVTLVKALESKKKIETGEK